ncbi:anthranilate phosphoribosyltransferase [Halobacteriales archaeon Cl-PHB]
MSDRFGDWPIKRLMTEVVGSGPKSADDMDPDQAAEAMDHILAGDPAPLALGGFWTACRWKRNTPTELAAFTDVMRTESVETAEPDCDPVDCGANYDGKDDSALLGVAAGLVAAAAGTPVVVHSGDRIPTQEGTAYKHVLDALDVRTDLAPAESAAMADEVGFGFYYQPAFNPKVDDLYPRRAELGLRSFVNTVETLANPANATVHLGSFFHLAFAERIIDTLAAAETQPIDRVLMVQGLEGYDDVRPGRTKVAEWDEGVEIRDFEIRTANYGMDLDRDFLAVDDVAADSAEITETVLTGERTDGFADAVAMNAALRIYAGGDVDDLESGLEAARAAIADGSAAARLDALRSV